MNKQEVFDVTVIGGGPAGLYSTFYSGLREMKTKLIEYQPALGGKLHVYLEKMIWDVGGVTPIQGEKLRSQLVQQGLTFDPTVVLNEKIVSISKNRNGTFLLKAASGQNHYSKTVIVAVGGGILQPKKLQIEDADRFEDINLHYAITSLKQFKDRTVLISGGGNTAIDWALELEPIAKKVYIAYRKNDLSGHEAQCTQLVNSSVQCMSTTTITKFIPTENDDRIEKVELSNQDTEEITYIDVDHVIINHGYEQDTSLLQNSAVKIKRENDYFIAGNSNSETSVAGLYAAGDILSYDGKLHLIAGCFQDAANAVNKAKQYINPTSEQVAMVSSHNEMFQRKNRTLMKEMIN